MFVIQKIGLGEDGEIDRVQVQWASGHVAGGRYRGAPQVIPIENLQDEVARRSPIVSVFEVAGERVVGSAAYVYQDASGKWRIAESETPLDGRYLKDLPKL